jgi:hypothetical protein
VRVHEGDAAADLEAVPPLGDSHEGTPGDIPDRSHGRRKWALIGVCAALALVISFSTGVALGRRGREPRRPVAQDAATTTSGPTRTTAESSTTLSPPRRSTLHTLFNHVSPTGIAVTARAGFVSTAEARGCPVAATQPFAELPGCPSAYVEGVQFDFTAPGQPSYRLTVLTSDSGSSSELVQPVAIESAIRVIRADGSTTEAENPRLVIAAFRVAASVSMVRVTLSDGTPETMTPIDGWAAVAAVSTGAQFPFRASVDGLDDRGRVVSTTQVQKCC